MEKYHLKRNFSMDSERSGNVAQPERKIVSQRSKKPNVLDAFLESKQLCRKRIPRDDNSLFRCLADQLMGSQTLYPDVRKAILTYFWDNQSEVEKVVSRVSFCDVSVIDYMFQKVLTAICYVFKVHISVYKEHTLELQTYYYQGPDQDNCKTITMSVDVETRWDSIYPTEVMENLAFCQSIAYEMLYERTFSLKNVQYSRANMLDKSSKKMSMQHFRDFKCLEAMKFALSHDFSEYDEETDLKVLVDKGIPPFPYKVAKSLDPNIYRNIEHDVWESQKDSCKQDVAPESVLCVGCKCIVHVKENIKCYGYVQHIKEEEGVALVFVQQIGEIRELPVKILEAVGSSCSRVLRHRRASGSQWKRSHSTTKMHKSDNVQEDSASDNQSDGGDNQIPGSSMSQQKYSSPGTCLYPHSSAASYDMSAHHYEDCDTEVSDYAKHQDSDDGYEDGLVNETMSDSNEQQATAQPANSVNYLPYVAYPQPVNLMVDFSYAFDGSDLPFNDITTLRYLYNCGVESVHAMRYGMYLPPTVPLHDQGYSDAMPAVPPMNIVAPQTVEHTYYADQQEVLSAAHLPTEPVPQICVTPELPAQIYVTPETPTYVMDTENTGMAQQLPADYHYQFQHIPQAYYLPTNVIPQYVANCPPPAAPGTYYTPS